MKGAGRILPTLGGAPAEEGCDKLIYIGKQTLIVEHGHQPPTLGSDDGFITNEYCLGTCSFEFYIDDFQVVILSTIFS